MRRLTLVLLVVFLAAPATAQPVDDTGRIHVLDLSGPLDDPAVGYLIDSITGHADAEVIVIQIDSPAVVATPARFSQLLDLVADPPVPVAIWVGPAPAVAYGGVVDLLLAAQVKVAAPGVEIGLARPVIAADPTALQPTTPPALAESFIVVEAPVPPLVDIVSPAIRQVLQELDGVSVTVGGESRRLTTLTTEIVDGQEVLTTVDVVYHKPGLWARFLRLASTPEAAFLFLVAGLTIAAFEFYAIGPGVAAGVAAVSLFLAGSGLSVLPVRWWAVAGAVVGWWLMTVSYQRGGVAFLTGAGSILMLVGGIWFVEGAPQLEMNPLLAGLTVAAVTAFYVVAMPTVARARFSTRTIGRDHLIGREGVATVDFSPDGEVQVDGARWPASAHREAGISRGDRVRVTAVDGTHLEIEPAPPIPKSAKTK